MTDEEYKSKIDEETLYRSFGRVDYFQGLLEFNQHKLIYNKTKNNLKFGILINKELLYIRSLKIHLLY